MLQGCQNLRASSSFDLFCVQLNHWKSNSVVHRHPIYWKCPPQFWTGTPRKILMPFVSSGRTMSSHDSIERSSTIPSGKKASMSICSWYYYFCLHIKLLTSAGIDSTMLWLSKANWLSLISKPDLLIWPIGTATLNWVGIVRLVGFS